MFIEYKEGTRIRKAIQLVIKITKWKYQSKKVSITVYNVDSKPFLQKKEVAIQPTVKRIEKLLESQKKSQKLSVGSNKDSSNERSPYLSPLNSLRFTQFNRTKELEKKLKELKRERSNQKKVNSSNSRRSVNTRHQYFTHSPPKYPNKVQGVSKSEQKPVDESCYREEEYEEDIKVSKIYHTARKMPSNQKNSEFESQSTSSNVSKTMTLHTQV